MFSFKDYIKKKWLGFEQSDTGTIHHMNTVKGKSVKVMFKKNNRDETQYDAHFSVDNNFYAQNVAHLARKTPKVDASDSAEILKHVHSTIHKFVKTYKPKAMGFVANEDIKNNLYRAFAKSVAKKYKANTKEYGDHTTIVHFDHDKL